MPEMVEEATYFLTVDWCDKGERGVFCNLNGIGYPKEGEPHTEMEMMKILDVFWIILKPKSTLLTKEELTEYTYWYPLAEYSNQFGVALKSERTGK